MNIIKRYELIPTNGRKSFYGKARVEEYEDGSKTLFSYETPIITKKANGELVPHYTGRKFGPTTGSHCIEFCGLNKNGYRKLLKANGMKFVNE